MADEEDMQDLPERRLVMIGARRDGKGYSANTILRKELFECGRIRTAQSEVRHEIVEGRHLVVVDTPGWKNSCSLGEITESDKQQFKLHASKCPPGPHVFLLVIAVDYSFPFKQRKTIQEHMKLLGDRAWGYTMVLFTFGDYLGNKTIEEHIEREGEALTWLIEKCHNRYHVFNNKDKRNLSQVTQLMKKIDEMVDDNDNTFYRLDSLMIQTIEKKQKEVAQKAEERLKRSLEQRKQMKIIAEGMKPIQKLRIILLGSRSVGKTSAWNTILGIKDHEEGITLLSHDQQGLVGEAEVTIVDTPGWQRGHSVCDTPEMIKDEILHSLFKCSPGPQVFLLVIDADASFSAKHLDAAVTHVELFGENVWKHTLVLFTHGDSLLSHSIEEYIEGEGKALQSLVERCGNLYHVLDNTNEYDSSQVDELLEKITLTLAGNALEYFTPNPKMLNALIEKEKRVEKAAQLRSQLKATKTAKGAAKKLKELRILILGESLSGKTTAANCLLRSKEFPGQPNGSCKANRANVAGRHVTVVDTPGWFGESECTCEKDREIVRGLTLIPQGFDAVLIVISLDVKFNQASQDALEDHFKLFDDSIWNHTMVLFSNKDTLGDRSVEKYIERETALRWLLDKCANKYHCLNITETSDVSQHHQLFTKIEDMSVKNQGRLFHPKMNDINLRIDEKFQKIILKRNVQHVIKQAVMNKELQLLKDHKENLEKLHGDIKAAFTSPLALGTIGKHKVKKKSLLEDIENQIDDINGKIMMSMQTLRSSMDFGMPSLGGSIQDMDKVPEWLSKLQISTHQESNITLNSETSGYRSEFSFTSNE